MGQDYLVREIHKHRPWEGQHGPMVDYQITVEGPQGSQRVTNTRKADSPPPVIGESIYGHTETETIPKRDGTTFEKTKLKREQRPDGVSTPPSPGPQGGQPPPPQSPDTPTQAAGKSETLSQDERIHWAVCLKAAAEIVAHRSTIGGEKWKSAADYTLAIAKEFFEFSPNSPTSTGHSSSESKPGQVGEPVPAETLEDRVKDAPADMSISQYDEGF